MNNETSVKLEGYSAPKVQPVFKGFTLQLQTVENQNKANLERLKSEILEAVAKIIPEPEFEAKKKSHCRWDPGLNPDLIEITISPGWSVAEAWDLTYKLRQLEMVIYAEPRFALQLPSSDMGGSCGAESDIPEAVRVRTFHNLRNVSPERHLEQMQIKEAWELINRKNKRPGEGVVIALPDTGFLPHPELDLISPPDGPDSGEYVETKLFSEDEVVEHVRQSGRREFPVNVWHGTATASVIISPEGQQQVISPEDQQPLKSKKNRYVTGVAPGATLKRYPLGPTLLNQLEFFMPGLAKAINDAAKDENVRVISISFGGYPALSLRRAIINAQRKGIIVVASAGNRIPFAVWPSTYADVISVASSDFNGQTLAEHSAKGSRIDVAAPGELIMVAVPTLDEDSQLAYTVEPRSGTSYAAPLVAGVAALWLSYHGWDELLEKYKIPARIPLVFDKLLRETCNTPEGWNTNRWGSGIVNAYNLLKAGLPDPDDPYIQEVLAYREIDHVDLDRGGVETFVHLFEETLLKPSLLQGMSAQMASGTLNQEIGLDMTRWLFSKVFSSDAGKGLRQYLRTFGREIVFHVATDRTLYRQMENLLRIFALKTLAEARSDDFKDDLDDMFKALRDEMLSTLRDRASDYLKKHI